jgi:hypothetical protein
MDNRKKLIRKAIIRAIVVITLVVVIASISTNAIVSNNVALGQLNGGDEGYLIHELYNKYRSGISIIIAISIGLAIFPIIKIFTMKNEK